MKNRNTILSILLVLLSVINLYACDVNLFSLIAGNTKEKSFIEDLAQRLNLTSDVQNIVKMVKNHFEK